jgi:hypothetical protein
VPNWQKPFRGARLNVAHPLTKGLKHSLLFNESTGNLAFDATNNVTPSGVLQWVTGGAGFINNANGVTVPVTHFSIDRGTFFWFLRGASSSIHGKFVCASGGSATDVNFQLCRGTADTMLWADIGTGTSHRCTFTVPDLWDEGEHRLGYRYLRGSWRDVWVDDTKATPQSCSNALTSFPNLGFGNRFAGSDRPVGASFFAVYYWDRTLLDDELQWVFDAPYAMFEQPSRAKYFYMAADSADPTLTQHSFRFYDDDGSESAATALAAENTALNLSPGATARLRFLIDADGNPDGKQFQVEYRKKPSGGTFGNWTKVQ